MFSANPRSTPASRLLRELHYDEAQEIASSGAKVLHPRCVMPVRTYGIPLFVYATQTPDLEGTHITGTPTDSTAKVKAVCVKKGITLVSMDSPGMWHEVGFLADAFQIFKTHGLSVDQVSTSETNVTVTLDPQANTLDAATIDALDRRALAAVPRTGDRALRFGEPRGSQHPRHPAQAGRGARVLRRAEDPSREPGRQRPELHLRRRRVAGRPAGGAAACAADPSGAGRPRARADLGRTVPQARGAGATRMAGGGSGRRRNCCRCWAAARRPMSTTRRPCAKPRPSCVRCSPSTGCTTRSRRTGIPRSLQLLHAAGIAMECVSQAELEHVFATLPGISIRRRCCSRRTSRRAPNTNGRCSAA